MMIGILFVAALAAFLVSAIAGGGAGLVLVPLLRLVVPIASVPAALSIGTAVSALSRIAVFRGAIRWDVVRRFLPAALPATTLGAWLLTRFEPAYVELIIAGFLLANLPALFRRKHPGDRRAAMPLARMPLIGALAGLLSGFTGAVGLLFNGVYQRLGMTPHEIVATRATNEVLLHLLKIALYWRFGLLDRSALAAGALIAAAAVAASVAVRWSLARVKEALFRRIGQVAMVAAGVAMLMLSSSRIAALHRTWVGVVAPEGEREVQVYWNAQRKLAIELEPEGYVVLERVVVFNDLPPAVRRAALSLTSRASIKLVEEVRSPHGRGYELYYHCGDRLKTAELRTAANGAVTIDP